MSSMALAQDPAPLTMSIVSSRYVTIELAALMTGFTPGAIRTKITKGVWVEGRQYVKRDGRVLIDMKGYEAWAEKATA